MSSMWASALTSLDDSLAALDAVTQQFEAATPVDLPQAIERLKGAAESSRGVRAYVLSELPDADWQDRQGLDGLLEAIDVQHRRSEILALATELERGNIVHRRAARVTQLNELRTEAIEELRKLAASEAAPPNLPGPAADRWMDWACALQEPDDTAPLQSLRSGFPWLDEFVAALEPGMWVPATPAASQTPAPQVTAEVPKPSVTAPAVTAAVMAGAAAAAAPALAPVAMPAPSPAAAPVAVTAASVAPPAPAVVAAPAIDPVAAAAHEMEQRKTRLLALATELERGSVVHNRAIRVTQVNQLREQAIQELRFQAVVAREPATLPGPEPDKWVQWACTLEEPDDAEALQTLRDGFVHLDEFVANLEPDMWVPAGPPHPVVATSTEASRDAAQHEKPRGETGEHEKPQSPAKVLKPAAATAAFSRVLASAKSGASGLSENLPPKLASFWRAKWRILLPGAVLLVVLLAAMQWQLHRTHASNSPVRTAEAKTPDTAEVVPPVNPAASASTTTAPAARPPDVKDKNANSKSQVGDAKPAPAPPPQQEKQVNVLNDGSLRTPQAMPKTAVRTEEVATAEAPGSVPGALPGGVSGNVTNVVKDVPVSTPRLPQQKIRVSSGVAQGQLIHQVQPAYPPQAKLAGISGTVVLQAVVSKDGTVQNVKALRGPPILIQPAVDAVRQWRYKPFAVNGEAAEAEVEINLKFASQ